MGTEGGRWTDQNQMASSGSLDFSVTDGGHEGGTLVASRIAFTPINLQHDKDVTAQFVKRLNG